MDDPPAVFSQLNLVVRDMQAALAFYRLVGLSPEEVPDGSHAEASLPGGLTIEWDTASSAARWDSGSPGPGGGSIVLGFGVQDRHGVDELFAKLTAAGYHGRQRPFDAFFGARYAIVDDPDGNGVGLMSPADDGHRHWPPRPAPAG